MKRILLSFISILLVANSIFSQVTHSISIGPDLGVGANFGKSAKPGIGASVEYVAKISSIGIRLASGYNKFNDKNYDNTWVSFFTVRGGIQAFIYQDIFFLFSDVGIATYKDSNPDPSLTKFSWALGGGYRQNFMNNQFLQFSTWFNYFRHNPNLTYTWFNFRVAYGFNFGKKKNKAQKEE